MEIVVNFPAFLIKKLSMKDNTKYPNITFV